MIGSIINRGLDWLFPEYCPGCNSKNTPLCQNCAALIPPPRDLENPGLLAALPYEHAWVKKLIWRLKYYRGRHLAERLAEIISERLLEELADISSFAVGDLADGTADKWLVAAVPVSATRKHARGFNQAEVLAKHLAWQNSDFLEFKNGLVEKIKDTLPQAKILNRKKRLENVRDSFAVAAPARIRGRRIIVVDDVITTGATVGEIKRVLKDAGARVVLGIALAHG